jgi:hypothetical protein
MTDQLPELSKPKSRWVPGQSGNPAGKPKGIRNKATVMAERLMEKDIKGIIGKATLRPLGTGATRSSTSFAACRSPARACSTTALVEGAAPGRAISRPTRSFRGACPAPRLHRSIVRPN